MSLDNFSALGLEPAGKTIDELPASTWIRALIGSAPLACPQMSMEPAWMQGSGLAVFPKVLAVALPIQATAAGPDPRYDSAPGQRASVTLLPQEVVGPVDLSQCRAGQRVSRHQSCTRTAFRATVPLCHGVVLGSTPRHKAILRGPASSRHFRRTSRSTHGGPPVAR